MLNSLFRFIKNAGAEGRRIENNLQSVKEKQIRDNSFTNLG
jgi:hypothetical protein